MHQSNSSFCQCERVLVDFTNERKLGRWKKSSLEICSGLGKNTLLSLKALTSVKEPTSLLHGAAAWASALLTIV